VEMNILAIIGQKGGNGKTTAAIGLGVAGEQAGRQSAVIDLDPQATATKWSDRRSQEAPAVVSCQVSRLPQVLEAAAKGGVQLAIIDTPGKSTDAAIAAAKAANFVLIPIQPQLFDIETLDSVKDILALAGNPPAAVVVNRASVQGKRHIETQEAATAQGFTVCPVVIFARAAHGDAGNIGQTAAEYDPKGKAAQEMSALYHYISRALYPEERRHEKKYTRRRA
jgi:chromosome partitioning protein